jgi:methionine synthase I (cobalamin-dependent)
MLETLLGHGRPLLADGAMGANLLEMGLTAGDSPELWNVARPDRIRALHRSFVDAGADIILTNSFGGNRRRLMLHQLEDRTRELNRLAAEIASSVAKGAKHPVVVAGAVGPTGDFLAPLGPLTEEKAFDIFVEQIQGLKDGGADVVWIETMSSPDEIRAAARAAGSLGMPYTVTASFDAAGETTMGVVPPALAELTFGFDPSPLALGANCGVGPADLIMSILAMTEARPEAIVIAKASAGIPERRGAHIHYPGTPEVMATYARLAIDAGARIIGGCCGASPAHLAAMRRAIDGHVAAGRPRVADVVCALGPLVAPASLVQGQTRTRRSGSASR